MTSLYDIARNIAIDGSRVFLPAAGLLFEGRSPSRAFSALAHHGVWHLVALAVAPQRWTAQDQPRADRTHPPYEPRKSAVGRAANPRRAAEVRVFGGAIDGRKIYGARSARKWRPIVEDISTKSRRRHRLHRPVHRPYVFVRATLWLCRAA